MIGGRGARYFVNPSLAPSSGTYLLPSGAPAYREYVICNEAMVERWAVGSDAIAGEIADEIAALEALRAHLAKQPAPQRSLPNFTTVALNLWNRSTPITAPDDAFSGALAFINTFYLPEEPAVAAIVARLGALPPPQTKIEHVPSATFPRADLPKLPVKP